MVTPAALPTIAVVLPVAYHFTERNADGTLPYPPPLAQVAGGTVAVVPSVADWTAWMALPHQYLVFPGASLTVIVLPAAPVTGEAEMVGSFGGLVWLAYIIRNSPPGTGASAAFTTAIAHPKRPALI